jgi:hypothetical protein
MEILEGDQQGFTSDPEKCESRNAVIKNTRTPLASAFKTI